jgi:uncharacterized alpha/beta hydrolase family protein
MKNIVISIFISLFAAIFVVSCAKPVEVTKEKAPVPTEEVVIEQVEDEKSPNISNRAKRLLRVIFGGVNK